MIISEIAISLVGIFLTGPHVYFHASIEIRKNMTTIYIEGFLGLERFSGAFIGKVVSVSNLPLALILIDLNLKWSFPSHLDN